MGEPFEPRPGRANWWLLGLFGAALVVICLLLVFSGLWVPEPGDWRR
jgi:hypothetical protein